MNSPQPYAIGIDFGGTSVKMACIAPDGTIGARDAFPTAGLDGVDGWLSAVKSHAATLRAETDAAGGRLAGVGVGVPGFVDFGRGFVHALTNVPGWVAVPLADRLQPLSKTTSTP